MDPTITKLRGGKQRLNRHKGKVQGADVTKPPPGAPLWTLNDQALHSINRGGAKIPDYDPDPIPTIRKRRRDLIEESEDEGEDEGSDDGDDEESEEERPRKKSKKGKEKEKKKEKGKKHKKSKKKKKDKKKKKVKENSLFFFYFLSFNKIYVILFFIAKIYK